MSIQARNSNGELLHVAGLANVDAILSPTSKNAIQNKAVYNALKDKLEKATTDLIYYYTVNDVYNKSEVRALIGAVETLTMEVVSSLPVSDISTTTIYLLKPTGSNVYDEYVYINDAWVKIGTTDMDLSGYMLTADFNVAIADYFTKAEINNLLNSYYTKAEIDADFYDKDVVDDLLDAKQDALTFDTTPTASSSNPVTSDGIKDAIDDTATDIYEVMGKNGAKNLLHVAASTSTVQGVTYTVNSDGTITVSASSAATGLSTLKVGEIALKAGESYILSGGVSDNCRLDLRNQNSSHTTWADNTDGKEVLSPKTSWTIDTFIPNADVTLDVYVRVPSGAQPSGTFYPMIRLASDTDSTYQPYAETNYQLTQDKMSYADNGILGAKNLLPNNKTTATVSGVTYTSQSDGSFIVTGATTTIPSYSDVMSSFTLPAGTYIFSSPNTGITSDIELVLDDITSGTAVRVSTLYNSTAVTFTLGSTRTLHCYMWVNSNITLPSGGVHFYPMIRLASDPDSTYQPYAMTNQKVTSLLTTDGAFIVPVVLGNTYSMAEVPYRCNHVKLETLGVLGNVAVYISSVTLNVYNKTFIYTETQSLVNLLAADSHYTGLTKAALVAEGGLHAYLSIVD